MSSEKSEGGGDNLTSVRKLLDSQALPKRGKKCSIYPESKLQESTPKKADETGIFTLRLHLLSYFLVKEYTMS